MYPWISRTLEVWLQFCEKKCGLYMNVYGSSSVKVGFRDITLSILEKFQSLHVFEALVLAVRQIEHVKAGKTSWVLLHNLFNF